MTSKVHWKFLMSLALCLIISKAAFVSHNYELGRQPSNGTNVASIDILDDAAFDIRYSTKCNSCKCFLEMPILTTYESQLESSFTGELIQSSITKGRLYLLHRSAQSAISYSIFDVKLPSTLTKIVKQVAIPSFTGINNIVFSPGSPAFVGYSAESGSLVINKIDGEGHIKENSYSFTNSNGEIYDMAYVEDLVFFARGERGLEVITVKNSNLESALLSLEDLEVKEGFEVKKLEVDYENKILYLYDPNSEQGSVVTLDYSSKDEISLINNYELGIKQITQLVALNNKLIVINKEEDEKYNYFEYLRVPSDKYDKPEMIKFWHFSQKINSIQRSGNDILIDADDYLYIFRKDLPYETETSQLIIDLIRKEEAGDYFLMTKDNDKFLLKVSSSKFALDSIQQRPSVSLKCGIYKEGGKYALDIPFTVDIYRDSCTDAPTKSADNVCLDRYTFDVSFTGNKFLEFDANTYAISPNPVHLSNWNEIPVQNNGTVVSHGSHGNQTEGPEDDGGLVTPIKKPDLIEPDAPYNDRINNIYLLVIVGVIILTCFGCVIKCLIDFVRTSKARLSDQYKHQQLEEEEPGSDEDEQDAGPQNASEVRKAVSPTDEESEEQY